MKDFLCFRRMLTPVLIQILFWLGVIGCFGTGIYDMAHKDWTDGLQIFFLGPIAIRIAAELIILFFRMNETLTDIKNEVQGPKAS